MKIDVDGQGLDRARLWMRAMARNTKNLYPLANKATGRWHESEGRTFAERAGWEPRKASTTKRYNSGSPIKTLNGPRKGRAKGKGPGFFTGNLHRGLTKPHQRGITNRVEIGRGRLVVTVGIKGGRNPKAYGNWQGDGARGARPGLVSLDELARRDIAADTRQHIIPRDRG